MTFSSSVFPNDDDDYLGERKANATFAADDEDDDSSSNNNRLLARSFSHAFSSSSFSLVRSNTSSSIGFVNNIVCIRVVSSVSGVFCVLFFFVAQINSLF